MQSQVTRQRIKRWLVWVAVGASLIWTALNWSSGYDTIRQRLGSVPWFVAGILVTEALFIVGAGLALSGLGVSIFAGTRGHPWAKLKRLAGIRALYQECLKRTRRNRLFLAGFYMNWLGAAGTAVVGITAIMVVLPMTAWGLLVVPAIDLGATFALRQPIKERLAMTQASSAVQIRPATPEDAAAMAALDKRSYGSQVTEAQTDDPETMFRQRVINSRGWTLVAVLDGVVEGLVSMQPMRFDPDAFTSWHATTSNGTLANSHDPASPVVYAAALTVSARGSQADATDLLIAAAVKRCLLQGKRSMFFAARMPGYARAAAKSGLTAKQYYEGTTRRHGKLGALDTQLYFYEQLGMQRLRLVENGFPEDHESMGYSVLFRLDVPFYRWPGRPLWGWVIGRFGCRPRNLAFMLRYL